MSRLAWSRFLKCSYSSKASFILYCMFHLLQPSIAVWLFVAICVIPSDNVMKGHLEMNDAPCHSLDFSFSISLCHTLIHLLSFLNLGALAGRGADLIREWAAWIGGICVASALAPGWPDAFSGNPSFSTALSRSAQALLTTTHTIQSSMSGHGLLDWVNCLKTSYLYWKPYHLLVWCPWLLALFWFERGQNTRCFRPALPVSSGYRPQPRASTVYIRKNSKRARAKATASCNSGRQCLRLFQHLVWLLGLNMSSVLSFSHCSSLFCIIILLLLVLVYSR